MKYLRPGLVALALAGLSLASCSSPLAAGDAPFETDNSDAEANVPIGEDAPSGQGSLDAGGDANVAVADAGRATSATDAASDAGATTRATDGASQEGAPTSTADDAGESIAASDDAGTSGAVTLTVPATSGSLAEPYDVSISATTNEGDSASIVHGVGTVTLGGSGPIPVFVYEMIDWSAYGYVLYQALAVGPNSWKMIWFYCEGANFTDASGIEYEGTDQPTLATPNATGTCRETNSSVSETVSLPQSRLALGNLVQGFTVSGGGLEISNTAVGSMSHGAATYEVFPFAWVDCSTDCGAPGWYELHSLYWNANEACFGIFYLVVGDPDSVVLEYSVCLPSLDDPSNGYGGFNASWSKQ
jgi:hypothetical protein